MHFYLFCLCAWFRDDIVPRLNKNNLRALAAEISRPEQVERANRWGAVDYRDAKQWVTTIGKAKLIRDQSASLDGAEATPASREEAVAFQPVSATAPVQPTTDFAAGAAAAATTEPVSRDRTSVSFVVPGKVIHLVETEEGTLAALGTFRMGCLQVIYPILDSAHQHTMRVYTTAMRHAKACMPAPPAAATAGPGSGGQSLARVRGPRQLLQIDSMRSSACGKLEESSAGYNKCGICKADGAWPLVLQSNATRALTMQNCK